MARQIWEVVEHYDGRVTVLDECEDQVDALLTRDWHREQWSDQDMARKCVFVRRKQ